MIRRTNEVNCPKCGSTVNRDNLRSHGRRQHGQSVTEIEIERALGKRKGGVISCKSCGKQLPMKGFIQHRCRSRSLRTLEGGGPGTGKRR